MARYTDIDQLIDKVEETTWYHINKNGELVAGANSETDIPLYKHSDITKVLAEAPVADVMPMNEEELIDKIASYFENENHWYDIKHGCWLVNGRSEALRRMLRESLRD